MTHYVRLGDIVLYRYLPKQDPHAPKVQPQDWPGIVHAIRDIDKGIVGLHLLTDYGVIRMNHVIYDSEKEECWRYMEGAAPIG